MFPENSVPDFCNILNYYKKRQKNLPLKSPGSNSSHQLPTLNLAKIINLTTHSTYELFSTKFNHWVKIQKTRQSFQGSKTPFSGNAVPISCVKPNQLLSLFHIQRKYSSGLGEASRF